MATTALPFWNQGTATLTNGSTTVTGQGTAWLTAGLREFDQIEGVGGNRATIQSINSATSITLDRPWQGGNQSAAAYKIWRTPDEVVFQERVRQLVSALGTGNIEALAGLTLAANTLPYGSGAGSLALTPLTAAARALLGDSTVPRSGTGGSQHRPNSGNDERFMQMGAFGFGGIGVSPPNNNLHEITQSGIYTTGASTLNTPPGGSHFTVFAQFRSSDSGSLLAISAREPSHPSFAQIWFKPIWSGDWYDWVSVSGEFSSNANGFYFRSPSGYQTAVAIINETSSAWTVADGAVFRRTNLGVTYPVSFVGMPDATASAYFPSGTPIVGCSIRNMGGASMNVVPWSSVARAAGTEKHVVVSIKGRWR